MPNANHITIAGNLTRSPELRFTPSGQATTNFGVAVNRRWKDRNDEWQEATSFFDVTAWGQLAENSAQSLEKGDRVVVEGRLDQRSWETQEGERRSKIEITANDIAASTSYATLVITRNERRGPQDQSQYSEPVRAAAGASRGGYQDPDQEPF